FQLTVNLVAISTAVIGAVVLQESPLTAIQLLWVNLIMDTFASLALATDTPTDAMLKRKPYSRTKALVSERMMKHIIGQGIFQLVIILLMTFVGDKIFGIPPGRKGKRIGSDPTVHYTMVFNTFVFLQLFNEINARRIHDEMNVFEGIFSNQLFVGISVIQIVLQVCIVQFGGVAFGCVALNGGQWAACVLIGALSLPMGALLRLYQAQHMPSFFTICNEETPVVYSPNARSKERWQRTFSRLRTQLRVVKAFQNSVSAKKMQLMANF
ncbi:unnamed protein product, partial [Aphanomyces euteiches]